MVSSAERRASPTDTPPRGMSIGPAGTTWRRWGGAGRRAGAGARAGEDRMGPREPGPAGPAVDWWGRTTRGAARLGDVLATGGAVPAMLGSALGAAPWPGAGARRGGGRRGPPPAARRQRGGPERRFGKGRPRQGPAGAGPPGGVQGILTARCRCSGSTTCRTGCWACSRCCSSPGSPRPGWSATRPLVAARLRPPAGAQRRGQLLPGGLRRLLRPDHRPDRRRHLAELRRPGRPGPPGPARRCASWTGASPRTPSRRGASCSGGCWPTPRS